VEYHGFSVFSYVLSYPEALSQPNLPRTNTAATGCASPKLRNLASRDSRLKTPDSRLLLVWISESNPILRRAASKPSTRHPAKAHSLSNLAIAGRARIEWNARCTRDG